ncbi:zeta toxin family protein [Streptomyces bohaiensis]|uniref:zeta toxin family protein n=1 Tax=Streptomyces bohaiensis TaxID=1431344 RepID=UPI003B806C84
MTYPTPLNSRDSALLFNRAIRPSLAGPASSNRPPVFVAVGGQPGAGKNTVEAAIRERLGLTQAYLLDGDDFGVKWEGHARAVRQNPLTAAYLAGESYGATPWWPRAARILRTGQRDVVATFPMGFPGFDLPRLKEFRDFPRQPYRVIASYVVVHEAISLQAVVDRFQTAKRMVMPESHDHVYRHGMLESAAQIYQQRAAHELHAVRRDGTVIYSNEIDPRTGQWRTGVDPRQVIEADRTRTLDPNEAVAFLQKQGRLRQDLSAEWTPLLDDIDRRAAPVLPGVQLLTDRELTGGLQRLAQLTEQAAVTADIETVRAKVLADNHRDGTNARLLAARRAAGWTPEAVDRLENRIHHRRWAQNLTGANQTSHVKQLHDLSAALLGEVRRRAGLAPHLARAEHTARGTHRSLNPGPVLDLPKPPTPVTMHRATLNDPGPGSSPARPPRPRTEASNHVPPRRAVVIPPPSTLGKSSGLRS